MLSYELSEDAPAKKWHPLATLAFIVVTCGAFWTAVVMGLSRIF